MNKNKIFLLVTLMICLFAITSCNNAKDSLEGDTGVNSDTYTESEVEDISSELEDNGEDLQNTQEDELQESEETEGNVEETDVEDVSTEQTTEEVSENEIEDKEEIEEIDEALEKISMMTLEEKIAQLFIVTPETISDVNGATKVSEMSISTFVKYPVGGVILMGGNVVNPSQLKTFTNDLQQMSISENSIPLFISIDEEGGQVSRIASNPNFDVPVFRNLSEITESYDNACYVGSSIGQYLSEYGINLDFAPVADVLTQSSNTVVGKRAFSSDYTVVSTMVQGMIDGLHEYNILTSAKHFPGHGNTTGDSHDGFAYSDKTLEEIQNLELIPFAKAIESGTDIIMMGHVSMEEIIGDNRPSSISYTMVTEVLREYMGYDGVVVTDALNMGALVNNYGSNETVILAVKAGVDMLLMPYNFEENYNALLNAVKNGEISENRIDESVYRILKLKSKL
ncbi:MAG: glycoside hydrolase family 3 N-terminal domain-containing protein [Lachnospirales bacterium]